MEYGGIDIMLIPLSCEQALASLLDAERTVDQPPLSPSQ